MSIVADGALYYIATREAPSFDADRAWSLCRIGPEETVGAEVATGFRGAGRINVSDDGSHVAMTFLKRDGSSELLLVATATGQTRAMPGGEQAFDPCISPDGSTVVFVDDATDLRFVTIAA